MNCDLTVSCSHFRYPKPGKRAWHLYNNHFAAEFGTTVDKLGARALAVTNYWWPLPGKCHNYRSIFLSNIFITLTSSHIVSSLLSSTEEVYVNVDPNLGYEDGRCQTV